MNVEDKVIRLSRYYIRYLKILMKKLFGSNHVNDIRLIGFKSLLI